LSIINQKNGIVKRTINQQIITNLDIITNLKIILLQGILTIKGKNPDTESPILTTKIREANYKGNMLLILNDDGKLEILNENFCELEIDIYSKNFLGGLFNFIFSSTENEKNKRNEMQLYNKNNKNKCHL
jgi:hypothetical protein